MFKFSRNRRGIPFFADFYASNLLWDKSSKAHHVFMEEFLNYTRKVLVENVVYCVVGELRHLESCSNSSWSDFFPGQFLIEFSRRPTKWVEKRYYHLKTTNYAYRQEIFRKNGGKQRFFKCAYDAFSVPNWSAFYGGPVWAEICKRTDSLIHFNGGLGELSVKIDMVIDSAHNTGRCLDKLYGGEIVDFLNRKTRGVDSQWLIKLAQPTIQKLRVL